jgi:hypothetical protein
MHRAALLLILVVAPAVSAQPAIMLPKPVKGKLPELVAVTAPSAACLAVGEASGWLAFGHDITYKDAHVSLVRLDAKGNPAAYSIPLKLPPLAPTLVKFANYPLALAFHPKLPLLYVWQEINVPFGNPPAAPLPGLEQFDHLLVYSVAKETPELIVSLCRGPYFLYGMTGGGLTIDRTGSHLYVPNMKDPKNYGNFLFGRFALDEAGLLRLDEKEAKLIPAAARPKRLTDLNAAKPILPHQITTLGFTTFFSFNTFGCGFGFHPVSKDAVVAGGWNGLITWQPDDPRLQIVGFSLRHSGNKFLGAHPDLPILFVTIAGVDCIYRVEHIDGLPTLVPQRWIFTDETLLSPPVVLPKSKKLVVGSRYHVNVVSLDEQGRCRPEVMHVPVFSPAVRALAYSERFERVYTGVEVSK